KPSDAPAIAATHDEAWRGAYQGIIPGPELDKLINRRGPVWWDCAVRKGSRITVLAFGECVAGYANYGRNRGRSLYYDGEIYELYLRPEFQGLGFGRKLFSAARRDLVQSGLPSLVIWALSDNEPAVGFYRALGGKAVARSSERFGTRTLDKVAFAWSRCPRIILAAPPAVIAGHSASEDARERAYDPAIHPLNEALFSMDANRTRACPSSAYHQAPQVG